MTDQDLPLQKAAKLIAEAREETAKRPVVEGFFDENTNTITYIVSDPATSKAAIIDSVLDYQPESGRTSHESANKVAERVEQQGLEVVWHLETHAHADHLSAAPYLQKRLGGELAIGRDIIAVQHVFGKLFNLDQAFLRDGSQFDHLFDDGEEFRIGNLEVIALHTPGHTPADMTFIIGDAAFVGDTMFMPDYGTARADFPGGDARDLYRSIQRLLALPDETRVFLCHDYKAPGRDEHVWETTIGEQRRNNVHVHEGVSEDEFVAMRTARDETLDMPTLILPSIQVNIRGGNMPDPEDNGVSYIKIPVDAV